MILLNNISLPLSSKQEDALERALALLHLKPSQVQLCQLYRISLDARKRQNTHFVCSVLLGLQDPCLEETICRKNPNARLITHQAPAIVPGSLPFAGQPVVVGMGPAGLFCALTLARAGYAPLIIEQGGPMEDRVQAVDAFWQKGVLSPQNNVQFGEGGAGTFSDGKLTTRISDYRCAGILADFVAFGAPGEILYRAKPHVGTEHIRAAVVGIRNEIIRLGGQVQFYTQLTDLQFNSDNRLVGICTNRGKIVTNTVVLALGHSARSTFDMLFNRQFHIQAKPFSVGVRIEHLQADIDRGLYGILAGHPNLPVGEYQLSAHRDNMGVYTFCMCPGGVVVPAASDQGQVVTNGMSYYARDGKNANSALVVGVDPSVFGPGPRAGLTFQHRLEQAAFIMGGSNYRAPAQTVGNFLANKPGIGKTNVQPTYALGVTNANLNQLFCPPVRDMLHFGLTQFGRKLPGFNGPGAIMTGVESRTSSPVRILRGSDYTAQGFGGVYPCGEGAGYAGGIMSAAVDGVAVAQQLISAYAPPR